MFTDHYVLSLFVYIFLLLLLLLWSSSFRVPFSPHCLCSSTSLRRVHIDRCFEMTATGIAKLVSECTLESFSACGSSSHEMSITNAILHAIGENFGDTLKVLDLSMNSGLSSSGVADLLEQCSKLLTLRVAGLQLLSGPCFRYVCVRVCGVCLVCLCVCVACVFLCPPFSSSSSSFSSSSESLRLSSTRVPPCCSSGKWHRCASCENWISPTLSSMTPVSCLW
jgi:hypothetical protein